MKDKAILKFGEVEYYLDFTSNEKLEVVKTINKPSSFKAELNKNKIIPFNYNERIEIYFEKNNKRHHVFSGTIIKADDHNSHLIISGADPLEMLKHKLISASFSNFTAPDILYHIVKLSGLNPKIHQTKFSSKMYCFQIIIPVQNLILKNFYIRFNKLKIIKNLSKKIQERVNKSDMKDNFLYNSEAFLVIELDARDYIDAYQKAYNLGSDVLDWLSYTRNFSLSKVGKKVVSWDFKNLQSKFTLNNFFYGEIKNQNSYLILNKESKHSLDKGIISSENKDKLNMLKSKFEMCYKNETKDITNSIHWLRRARELGDNKDKLLDCFTALEFLLRCTKGKELFSKTKREQLISMAESILDDKQKDRFTNYIHNINSISFKKKLELFLEKYKQKLSKSEASTLKNMRDKRNKIEHGRKDIIVEEDELRKLYNLIEKLIVLRLK